MDGPKLYRPSVDTSTHHAPSPKQSPGDDAITVPFGQERPQLGWTDVRSVVDEVCQQFAGAMTASLIESAVDMPQQLGIMVDRAMLHRALTALVANAVECMPRGGKLVITSYHGRGGLELEVADSGPGLSDDALRRAFDPYYSTKRNSAGLGLSHVRRIARAHGGDVTVMNCPEGGAAFTLRFPPHARQQAA